MSDLGLLSYYLGIEVCQARDKITLNQSAYALKILEKSGMADCNLSQIPMEARPKATTLWLMQCPIEVLFGVSDIWCIQDQTYPIRLVT